jgi:chitinase
MIKAILCILFFNLNITFAIPVPDEKPKPVIIAYVGGYRGLVATDSIDVWKVSHINYAFVDIKDNRAWLHHEATDTINLRRLAELKKINPDVKILISIGGWTWSKNFSDAVLSDTSTHNFVSSAVEIVSEYYLDGIDIDWEYPGMQGDNNVYRPEDKQHYTMLCKELRRCLDSLGLITQKKYYVTTAVGGWKEYLDHTEMDKVQLYVDYINLMSYDYANGTDTVSGHHANLYNSLDDTNQYSAHKAIQEFIAAGVSPSKLVMGLAFYGKGWQMESDDNNGLYRKALKPARGAGFTYLKDSLADRNGYRQYWDDVAMAPYLFNPENNIFITYDNERSVKNKCKYVKRNHLAGVMFWEYSDDMKEYLLKIIADNFKYDKKNNGY